MSLFEQTIFNFTKRINLLFENKIELIARQQGDKLMTALQKDHLAVDTFADEIEVLEHLALADPTSNNKYLQWLANRYIEGNFRLEDIRRIKEALVQFEGKKRSLAKKDINQYKSLADLEDAVEDQEQIQSKRQQKQEIKNEGADVVMQGPDGTILHLKTEAAACYYGKGTRWCTASTDGYNEFDTYKEDGPIYVFVGKDGRKFQFHFESLQFMNERDEQIDVVTVRDRYPTIDKFFSAKEEAMVKRENLAELLDYARNIGMDEWPALEDRIKDNAHRIVQYVKYVTGKRFPEAEKIIAESPEAAFQYALATGHRMPTAEEYIIKNKGFGDIFEYARRVLKGRWPAAEKKIANDPHSATEYAVRIIKGRFPEAEESIMKRPSEAIRYAKRVIKGRWPEAEPIILKNFQFAFDYAREVVGGRWPELEKKILNSENPHNAAYYAEFIIKDRWPEAHDFMRSNEQAWKIYQDFLRTQSIRRSL